MQPTRRLDALVRSERHFTSGLLVHLLLHDGLRGVDAFVDLLIARGVLDARPVASAAEDPRTQVVAEFAARRDLAILGDLTVEDAPRDVVDLIVVVGSVLIAVEAKFFTRPSPHDVREQLATQRDALAAIVRDPAFGITRVVQVFLEHGRELPAASIGCDGVLTWADVHALARDTLGAQAYATQQLANALERCDAEMRPHDPREPFFEGTVSYDEIVVMCRRQGDALLVGFAGGERALRQGRHERLRERAWKWDHASSPRNAKELANWIRGERFLAILRELGAALGN